jgi:phosphohistidine phosphatase
VVALGVVVHVPGIWRETWRDAQQSGLMTETKRLFVLRHAKSSWDEPTRDDHERPLAPRGRRAASVLAEHLKANGIHPVLVLCSTSRRTRETLVGIAAGGEHLIERELYSASGQELLERLRRVPEEVSSVMVIGHNPAMQTLVLKLAAAGDRNGGGGGDGAALSEVQSKFPTGALATLTFGGAWSELSPGCARLEGFVRPKSLAR